MSEHTAEVAEGGHGSGAEDSPMLSFEQIVMRYGPTMALDHINLAVRRGELLCLLGSSGSGKTTMLNIVGGFVLPDEGRVLLRGTDITRTRADRRNIGVVFQSYALFPHLTALENVTYGLRARKVPRATAEQRALELLELVGLRSFANRRPANLSGGQQQRVAVARALAPRPDVLLLDEPLSNLDVTLREDLGLELRRVHDETGITTIMVTHDPQEALSLGDRIAIMDHGCLLEVDTPAEIYRHPRSIQGARAVSKANILNGTVVRTDSGGVVVDLGTFSMQCPAGEVPLSPGAKVHVVVRRESFVVRPAGSDAASSRLNATVGVLQARAYRGPSVDMVLMAGNHRLLASSPIELLEGANSSWLEPGQDVEIEVRSDQAVVISDASSDTNG
jgi:ABC-type Fe3+/spermidine/putrescine transport system ATPase subunit